MSDEERLEAQKQRQREYARHWREAHRDEVNAAHRAWVAAQNEEWRERRREYNRAYYHSHPEVIQKARKKYGEKQKAIRRQRREEWNNFLSGKL